MTTPLSNTAAVAPPPTTSSWAMIRTLGGIALISGCLLSLVYQMTQAPIEKNTGNRIDNAVLELLPGATTQRTVQVMTPGYGSAEHPETVYAGYDDSGELVGVAIQARDSGGYGGEIRLMYGYLPEEEQISGMKVLLSRETPGLGDRIRTDPEFTGAFKEFEVPLTPDKDGLVHDIRYVDSDSDAGPGEINGISGATISSQAVVRAIGRSAETMLPVIHAHLNELKEGTL